MLTLRLANADDLAELRAIVVAAYAVYIPRMGRPPAPMTADYAGAVGRREVWVAASGGYRLTRRAEQDGFQRVFFTKHLSG